MVGYPSLVGHCFLNGHILGVQLSENVKTWINQTEPTMPHGSSPAYDPPPQPPPHMISNISKSCSQGDCNTPEGCHRWEMFPRLEEYMSSLTNRLQQISIENDPPNDRTTHGCTTPFLSHAAKRTPLPNGSTVTVGGTLSQDHPHMGGLGHDADRFTPPPQPYSQEQLTTLAHAALVKIRHEQQLLLLLYHANRCLYEVGTCPVSPHCAEMKRLWIHMNGCKDNRCSVNHCYSSRAVLTHYRSRCVDKDCLVCCPVRETIKKIQDQRSTTPTILESMPPIVDGPSNGFNHQQQQNPTLPPPSHRAGNEYSMHRDQLPPPMPQPLLVVSSQYQQPLEERVGGFIISTPTAPSPSSGQDIGYLIIEPLNSSEDYSYHHEKIRKKQQRLLLLRHAARCKHNSDNNCPVTPHCANMKRLREHIGHCKDKQCHVQHCLSSRCVLAHYKRCKERTCPVCGPIRVLIPV